MTVDFKEEVVYIYTLDADLPEDIRQEILRDFENGEFTDSDEFYSKYNEYIATQDTADMGTNQMYIEQNGYMPTIEIADEDSNTLYRNNKTIKLYYTFYPELNNTEAYRIELFDLSNVVPEKIFSGYMPSMGKTDPTKSYITSFLNKEVDLKNYSFAKNIIFEDLNAIKAKQNK